MIKIKNIPITFAELLTDAQMNTVATSHKLVNYINRNLTNDNVEIKSIRIYKVNFFGPNVGFIYLESEIYVNGKPVPGIGFIRGDSVAILLVLNTTNKKGIDERYSILVEQYRANVGRFAKGIPAGMIDTHGEVTSTAIQEIEEEVGKLDIKEEELIFLTKYNPSSGGCDETMIIYAVEKTIDFDELMSFQDRITGCDSENEEITLDVVKFDELPNFGSKAELSYNHFIQLKKFKDT